jgi:hypothetical protein
MISLTRAQSYHPQAHTYKSQARRPNITFLQLRKAGTSTNQQILKFWFARVTMYHLSPHPPPPFFSTFPTPTPTTVIRKPSGSWYIACKDC